MAMDSGFSLLDKILVTRQFELVQESPEPRLGWTRDETRSKALGHRKLYVPVGAALTQVLFSAIPVIHELKDNDALAKGKARRELLSEAIRLMEQIYRLPPQTLSRYSEEEIAELFRENTRDSPKKGVSAGLLQLLTLYSNPIECRMTSPPDEGAIATRFLPVELREIIDLALSESSADFKSAEVWWVTAPDLSVTGTGSLSITLCCAAPPLF